MYVRAEWLFARLLALIYLIAFVSFGAQITGLIGSRGILPLERYLTLVRESFGAGSYWMLPSVFWISPSDAALQSVCVAGTAAAVVLLLGFAQRACLAVLFALYLSLCSAGQDFMSFQWDMLLLETGFLAIFLGSSRLVVWLFRWLLFRLMFLSGAVKLMSHDPAWRTLDALRFHYWTQPLPTPLAWYMNQLPSGFQRASTLAVFLIELLVPFLIFCPRRARLLGAGCIICLQTMILLTGNYAFFNLVTMALCVFLLDDGVLGRWITPDRAPLRTSPKVAVVLALVILTLSGLQLLGSLFDYTPAPGRALLRWSAPFGIVNSYGLFAVMTTTRPEIVIQGSEDGSNWRDYEFKYKPGDLGRAPPVVAPHQPRPDWQMWFAALSNAAGYPESSRAIPAGMLLACSGFFARRAATANSSFANGSR